MKRLILLLLAAIFVFPLQAQEVEAPNPYPTVPALNDAELPPRDRAELAQRLMGVTITPPPDAAPPTRTVGEIETFTVSDTDSTRLFTIEAELRAVGKHIYLWVEQGQNIPDDTLQALADGFDERVYEPVRDLWGSEAIPGIDNDPRVHGLFARGLGSSTAAYFASDHTYPREAVPVSNEREMFFFNIDALASYPLVMIESVLAHEFQHMIRHNLQPNEETWMNEGFSEFTQAYFFNEFNGSIISFMFAPYTQLNDWNANPNGRAADYGAAALFMQYLYERFGIDFMRELSADDHPRGLQAVDNTLRARGEPGVNQIFADWVMANALIGTHGAESRFTYETVSDIPSPEVRAVVTTLPFEYADDLNQYGTDYFVFNNVNGRESLDIKFTAPDTVRLIPTYREGQYWYSNRGDMSDARLTHAFDLTNVQSATLNYELWYDFEEFWDYGYVMVSDDGGASWDILETPRTTDRNPYATSYGEGYTGQSGRWIEESLSLDAYARQEILVRFEVITDDAVNRPGMAIDEVSIPEINYFADFEAGGGDWIAEGWLLTDNRLPQGAWVQAALIGSGGEITVEQYHVESGAGRWTLPLNDDTQQVILAVSPYAPVTTVPMNYEIVVQ